MSQQFTYQDVAEHNTKKDTYLVIHDKVYDATKFIDEHPGGEEVIVDVAGQDATEAFEDVGHSDEARETLDKLYVGTLLRKEGDPKPKTTESTLPGSQADNTGMGIGLYALMLVGGLAAYFGYQYLQAQQAAVTA